MSTITAIGNTTGHHLPKALRHGAWTSWAAFLVAFAILEGVSHGTFSWLALAAGVITPDLSFFAAAGEHEPVRQGQLPRQAVPFYNTAHRTWIPFGLAVV